MDTTLVIGLGATGRSVIRHLDGRARLRAIDTRSEPPLLDAVRADHPAVEVLPPGDWPRALAGADRVVVSPGVPLCHRWVRDAAAAGVPLTSDIELCLQAVGTKPVVGVTGTNGKSTVVSLLGELLSEAGLRAGVGGNLGPPALDLIAEDHDIYALELSSFQLERLERPGLAVAVLLNVSADHGDRYASLDAYAAAKRRIFAGAARVVFNADDLATHPGDEWRAGCGRPGRGAPERGREAQARAIALNGDPRWRLDEDAVVVHGARLPARALALAGRHNRFNVLAAAAAAHFAGVAVDQCHSVLTAFAGLPHRAQHVATLNGVAFVNDSKATNVGACAAALEGLGNGQRNIVLIAGGDSKGASFAVLAPPVRRHVSSVVLLGRDAPRLEQALRGHTPTARAADMAEAVRLAHAAVGRCGTVLLSPACASFDMYAGFAARGAAFAAAVRALAAEEAR